MHTFVAGFSPKPLLLCKFHVKRGATPRISKRDVEAFVGQLDEWGVALGEEEMETLTLYVEELALYDKANVVGTREIRRLWLDHILDSLSCLLYKPLRGAESLIDVGSGGGMPGIPLHVVAGLQRTCLLESISKKSEFLRYASSRLSIAGLEVSNARAEDAGWSREHREKFGIAAVRAVAPLAVISEYCLPLLAPGGIMIAMKARIGAEELGAGERAAKILGGEVQEIIRVPFSSHVEDKERRLVLVKKVKNTPESYPRKPGVPKKTPLGGPE